MMASISDSGASLQACGTGAPNEANMARERRAAGRIKQAALVLTTLLYTKYRLWIIIER